MIICSFAGHRQVSDKIKPEIFFQIEKLVLSTEKTVFYSGGMGDFDRLCESAVRQVKLKYPEKEIALCRVLASYAYMPDTTQQQYMRELFDDVFVCDASDGTHYKSMITKRNRWMIDMSTHVIAYVVNENGGAYNTLKYAEKCKKIIINIKKEHCRNTVFPK